MQEFFGKYERKLSLIKDSTKSISQVFIHFSMHRKTDNIFSLKHIEANNLLSISITVLNIFKEEIIHIYNF